MLRVGFFIPLLIWCFARSVEAQALNSSAYEIGSPTLVEYFVDSISGSDSNSGLTRSLPKRTVTSIWNDIPESQALSSGYRINLLPGSYGSAELPNFWENRTGTATAPIILQAADGFGTAFLTRDINMAGVSYFYLLGLDIKNNLEDGYGDAFHCERCDHILLRGNSFNGAPAGLNSGSDIAHETVKFNQSQYIYIENNNIQGADDNAIDWVAVQYGHIRANRIHDTQGWCTYVKGGSSYILIESNLVYDCGEGGITAGQGTGFEFMESPWLRFEANYIKIVNNIVHDVEGAGLGVNGGYDVLLAHNTVYRVGTRSHLLEVIFGERSCDGDTSACQTRADGGGWGPVLTGSDNNQPIGNRNIKVFNNVFYNPAGVTSGFQHFAIYGPRTATASGIPTPQTSDVGLQIEGNVIWNGSSEMLLGIEESDQGCQSGNTTCNETQLEADNSINSSEPLLIDPANADFRPVASGFLSGLSSASIPDFDSLDTNLNPIPEGDQDNQMVREFSGEAASSRPPGAFASSSALTAFPESGMITTPGADSTANTAPSITSVRGSARRIGARVRVIINTRASDDSGINTLTAQVRASSRTLARLTLNLRGSTYTASRRVRTRATRIRITATAMDGDGLQTTRNANFRVR